LLYVTNLSIGILMSSQRIGSRCLMTLILKNSVNTPLGKRLNSNGEKLY
jgi:hypothetical protein